MNKKLKDIYVSTKINCDTLSTEAREIFESYISSYEYNLVDKTVVFYTYSDDYNIFPFIKSFIQSTNILFNIEKYEIKDNMDLKFIMPSYLFEKGTVIEHKSYGKSGLSKKEDTELHYFKVKFKKIDYLEQPIRNFYQRG